MTNGFNISLAPVTPMPNEGSNPKPGFSKVAEQPVTRKIPGLTQYNVDTGEVESSGEWKQAQPQTEKVKTEKSDKTNKEEKTTSRHQEWKAQQEAKRQATQEAKQAKQIQKQALAKDYLAQGNIVKAAESLGLSVADFLAMTQNAALSMPTKKEELTPEQKKAQEDQQWRESMQKRLEDADRFKYETVASNFIRDNIAPKMADAEKYQFLNQNPDLAPKIQRGIYEYLNQCYAETCVYDAQGQLIQDGTFPKIEDVLDTLETQYEQAAVDTLEKAKKIKKLSKFFGKQVAQEMVQEEPGSSQEDEAQLGDDSVNEEEQFARSLPLAPEEEEEERPVRKPVSQARPRSKVNSRVPFALMSVQDKIAYARNGGR